jgi:serine/threonine protein kinase
MQGAAEKTGILEMIGKTISHYRILEKIGEGGMGVVYKAEDTRLKRTVALKFLSAALMRDQQARERFVQEAQTAAALLHPNIATIFAFDEWEGQSFIVMEYVEGQTLSQLLKSGIVVVDKATEFIIAIADALSCAHKKAIIHRDIKPGNIMVTDESATQKGQQIKVMDFGLATLRERADVTQTLTLMGTAAYMSPEQAQGKMVDHRSDIFSLGLVMYEMLSGQHPFGKGRMTEMLYRIVHEAPAPIVELIEGIPSELNMIVNKTLAKDLSQRYQSLEEFLADLADYQYNPVVLAGKVGTEKKSIAVLPFDDISPGKENEYLADGMTEELIAALSQNKQLRVIARTSVMQYKKQAKDIRDIGRELGISYALEGSVRRFEDQLRITAQLIDTNDGSHLWASNFDGRVKDIFRFQERVAGEVSSALELELGAEPTMAPQKAEKNTEAYEFYLQGKFLLDTPILHNLDQSLKFFERALKLNPHNPDIYVGLANVYLMYVDTGQRPDPKYLARADEMAEKALAVDKDHSDSLYIKANLAMKKGHVEEAFEGFNRVLEIDPVNRDARWWRAILLCLSSYFEESLRDADRLLATNPFWPMAHWIHSTVRLYQGMFDAAVAEYEQVAVDMPTKLLWLALAYRYAGKMEKAWEAANKVKEYQKEGILWPIAFAFLEGAEGKQTEILEYVDDRVKDFGWDFHFGCYFVASFYSMAGDMDEAFRWLDRCLEIGFRNHRWFAIDPNLDNLRDDPRFPEIMEKARKESAQLSKLIL